MDAETGASQRPFTADRDPRAEGFVRDVLDEAVARVEEQSNPVAVLLQGSFARGEGTVRFDDGQPLLWRDLDLVLAYRTRERPGVLGGIEEAINDRPGIRPGPTPVEGGEISLAQLPASVLRRWRDLKTYELATASRLLSGEDVRPSMAVRDGRIPIESGLRFLYQKAKGLGTVHARLDRDPFVCNYEIAKLYIELARALCLLEDGPRPTHGERTTVLRASEDPRVRGIAERAETWGAYKTEGDVDALRSRDPTESWEQARDDLVTGLAIVDEETIGLDPDLGTVEGALDHYRARVGEFFPRTVATFLGRRWPPSGIRRAAGRLARHGYAGAMWLTGPADRRLLGGCPLLAFYVASALLVANLDPGTPPREALERVDAFAQQVGLRIPALDPERWPEQVDDVYRQLTRPLYGVA